MDAKTRLKYDKAYRHVAFLEKKIPAFKRISRHRKFGIWLPTILAFVEFGLGLLGFYLLVFLLPIIFSYLPDWGPIDIPFPDISLPTWMEEVIEWVRKSLPVLIALAFVIHEVRRRKK